MNGNSQNSSAKIGIDARLWNETGVGRYIRNLVIYLQKLDTQHDYKLFVLPKDVAQIKQAIVNKRWSIVPIAIPWHTLKEQLEYPKILEKEKIDLMHFPYFSVPVGYRGAYVLTIHDLILHHFPTGKASTKSGFIYWAKHIGYRYVLFRAAKHAAKIIAVSYATKKEIVGHLHVPAGKIIVTYEGVDEKIEAINHKPSAISQKYFLYVGNAYPHKNLESLVKAFAYIQKKISPVKLVLVGKKDFFYERLEKEVEKNGWEQSILFRHEVNDDELAWLYSHALALVIPSRMEGFGLPLIEAMKQQCVVVAADIPIFREIASDIPLYCNPTDINQLADVLESIAKGRIHDAKERKEKGKHQAKKFIWEKTAKETLAVYKDCIGVRQSK